MAPEGFEMAPEAAAVDPAQEAAAPQVYRKQDLNIYTVMLLISLVCLIVAIILLFLEIREWGSLPFPYKTDSAKIQGLPGLLQRGLFW